MHSKEVSQDINLCIGKQAYLLGLLKCQLNKLFDKSLWNLEDPNGLINILFCDLLRYLLPFRQQTNLQRVGTNIQTLQLIN